MAKDLTAAAPAAMTPAMLSSQRTIGSGLEGTAATLALMTRWKDFYGASPAIRAAALIVAGGTEDNASAAQLAELARFVRVSVVYQADPVNSEFLQSPDVMLADISSSPQGITRGDCDDHVLLFCALAESLGIPCSVAGVKTPGSDRFNHVIALAHLPERDAEVDLCAKNGWQPAYPEKWIVE